MTYALETSHESLGNVIAMENGQSGSDALTATSGADSAGQPMLVTLARANDEPKAADDSGAAFLTGNILTYDS